MAQQEGDAFSKLNALFKEGSDAADRAAKIELATVTSSAPNLAIRLDADGLSLDKDDLIVAEHLTRHDRIVSLEYTNPKIWTTAEVGDMELTAVSTRNNVGEAPPTVYQNFNMQYAKLTFQDVLKVGDRVLVACVDANMTYIILDRARWYD